MTFNELLGRLDRVRRYDDRRAKAACPAHHDRLPSLSIRELDDGTILLHDFGGCDALSICRAIGIEFRELFPDSRVRRVDYRDQPRLSASEALCALDHEVGVIAIIGADFLQQREIDAQDWQRLATAVNRIRSARALCCSGRVK